MNPLFVAKLVHLYGNWATLWIQQLQSACVQGATFIVILWLMCRLVPRLPAKTRHWLWRIVYCKLLIGLFWTTPVSLPLIAPEPDVPTHRFSVGGQQPSVATPSRNLNEVVIEINREYYQAATQRPSGTPPSPLGMKLSEVYLPGVLPIDSISFVIILLTILWASGVICCLAALLKQMVCLRRLQMRARSLAGTPVAAVAGNLAGQIGLRRCPRVVASHDAETPLITGLFRPVIVIPESALSTYTAADLRLILMHELMHIRAGDLWWMTLAALTETIFFFNPLVWLAGRDLSLAREAACDSAVLHTLGTPAPEYGRLLVKIVTWKPKRETFVASLGAAVGYRILKRRLSLLQFAHSDVSGPGIRLALVVLVICGCVFLVPWCITAQKRSIPLPGRYLIYPFSSEFAAVPSNTNQANASQGVTDRSRGVPMIGETLALPGQPQHLISYEVTIFMLHGYQAQLRDLGAVVSRWYIVHRDGAVKWGPPQPYPLIVGAVPDQTPRDTRLHVQLHHNGETGELHMTGDFPGSADGMEDPLVLGFQGVPRADSSVQASVHEAFFCSNSRIRFLGTLQGGTYSTAVAFNNLGHVVGSADAADGSEHAYLWRDGEMRDLGPGHPMALNDVDQIVGYYTLPAGTKHACLWQNGIRVDLGTLGGSNSAANCIDSAGDIVGQALDAAGTPRAFLYRNGKMWDLNDRTSLGTRLQLTSANFISDLGQIIAYGTLPQEARSGHTKIQRQAFRLTPR